MTNEAVQELQKRSEAVLAEADAEEQRIVSLLENVSRSRRTTDQVLRRAGYLK